MGKRDEYLREARALLSSRASINEIAAWLVANSNLPGRRGNLELAWAFGDAFREIDAVGGRWAEAQAWLAISEESAPTGDPREFLPFCALQAAGSLYELAGPEDREEIVVALKTAASDGRWRIRETVAMGFQRIAGTDFGGIISLFEGWIEAASLVERRAIVATLAHPDLLSDPSRARRSLALVEVILQDVVGLDREARRFEGFRVLRKGLQYAISVFVAAAPGEGFEFVSRWASVGDRDVRAILRANLKKARLAKRFPDRVAEAAQLLESVGA